MDTLNVNKLKIELKYTRKRPHFCFTRKFCEYLGNVGGDFLKLI